MPTYILVSTLTPEGRRTLHSDPDRLEEVNQEITDFGCEVVAQYAVLGSYDFITVIQAAGQRERCPSIARPRLTRHHQHRHPAGDFDGAVARETEGA